MEIKEILEGKKIDNLEDTSASEVTEEEKDSEIPTETVEEEPEKIPNLSASPVPTEEEKEDANLENNLGDIPVEEEIPEPESEEPVAVENVEVEAVVEEPQQPEVHEENGVTDMPALKTFTQNQVNEMVGNTRTETREKTFRYIYDRYGVKDEAELDELIGNAQRYDTLKEQYDNDKKGWKEQSSVRDQELNDVKERIALLESGIDKERFEDAKFILKGKGLEVSLDNIRNELATHPEWQKKAEPAVGEGNFVKKDEAPNIDTEPAEPVSKISVLGNERVPSKSENEEDYALDRLFKV